MQDLPRTPRLRSPMSAIAALAAAACVAVATPAAARSDPGDEASAASQSAKQDRPEARSFASLFAPFAAKPPKPGVPARAVDLSSFPAPLQQRSILRSLGAGVASYYGRRFQGRLTANGERFNMNALTAAHKTLPFGTRVRVTNPRNGKSVTVRINDRGPFTRGRVIDLSRAAARRIGLISRGHGRVKLDIVRK